MVKRTPRATDDSGLLLGDLAPGSRVGEYVIDARLASRGTGHVYRATHVVLPRRAAIKVMPAADRWVRAIALELLREACIVEALDHPGIPRLYECGTLPDRRPWIASEIADGDTVEAIAARRAPSPHEIACIVRDVADILAHAHGRGLVHRNVSPATIVIPHAPSRFPVCVADWSGARTHDSTTPAPMMSGPYSAPELLAGGAIDGRADIYSLGKVARELLRTTQPGSAPPVLVVLVEGMMAKDPRRRPACEHIKDAASWIVKEIEAETAIPDPVLEDATVRTPHAIINSDSSPTVVGEIIPRGD
jgi:serine/threonine-protein kinase